MFAERWLELAAGLAVVISTAIWVGRAARRRRLIGILGAVWGLLWAAGCLASLWFLRRAAALLDTPMEPGPRLQAFVDDLDRSGVLLTTSRVLLVAGFAVLLVLHLRNSAPPPAERGPHG